MKPSQTAESIGYQPDARNAGRSMGGDRSFRCDPELRTLSFFILVLLCLLTINTRAFARVVTWDGEAGEEDQSWHTADNWSDNTIPAAGDDVVLPDLGEGYRVKYDPQEKGATLSVSLNNITIQQSSGAMEVFSGTLTCSGSIEAYASSGITVRDGTLQADGPVQFHEGSILRMIGGTLVHTSALQIDPGGSLDLRGGRLQVDGILTHNGLFSSFIGGTLEINGTVTGTGVIQFVNSVGTGLLAGSDGIINMTDGGHFSATAGPTKPVTGTLTNLGYFSYAQGNLLFNNCTFTNAGTMYFPNRAEEGIQAGEGTNLFNNSDLLYITRAFVNVPFRNQSGGTLSCTNGVFNASLTNDVGGVIVGSGIDLDGGTLVNNGQLAPGGDSRTIMTISGNLTSGATSSVPIQLRGPAPAGTGYDHDQLNISGNATLDGSLEISLVTPYVPVAGDTMQIMTFGSRTGTFASEAFPALNPGLAWNVSYSETDIKLEVLSTSPITWSGGGDALSWTDPLNWDSTSVPGAEDDVVLPDLAEPYLVSFDTSETVNSVRLTEEVTVRFSLGGTTAGGGAGQYTQLIVNDAITLGDSTLEVVLSDGFTPSLGDTFTLINHGSRSGTFAEENLPTLAADLTWLLNYDNHHPNGSGNTVLKVVPMPTVTWDGGGDGISWSDANNWSDDQLPGPDDGVLLPDLGESYIVESSDSWTIDSLTIKSKVQLQILAGLLTCNGEVNVTAGSNLFLSGGDLQTDGHLTVLGYGYLTIRGTLTQNGPMTLALGASPSVGINGLLQVNGTLTLESLSFTLQGGTLQIDGTLEGPGGIFWQWGTLTGSGTIDLKDPGMLRIVTNGSGTLSGSLTNNGTITWAGWNDLMWDEATLTNFGEFLIDGSNSVNMTAAGGTNLFINRGLVRSNYSSRYLGIPFINRGGVVNAWFGGTIGFTSTMTNEEGATIMGLGTLAVSGADFANDGLTSLNGILTINGDCPMSGTSVVNLEIGGTDPGNLNPQHDQLNISGAATFGGTLNVTLWGNYTPVLGDRYEIVTYASHTGSFGLVNVPDLSEGLGWKIDYTATGVALVIITDRDRDGLSDTEEEEIYGTSPDDPDSDDDGLDDGIEVAYWGPDWNADPDGDELVNLLDWDSDNDGVSDGMEANPLDPLLGGTPVDGLEDWFLSEWFGYYNTTLAPWVYHAQHGFLFFSEGLNTESMFFYDDAMGAWWWTNSGEYPYLYAFDPPVDRARTDIESAWLWYFEGSEDPRIFSVLTGLSAGEFLFFNP